MYTGNSNGTEFASDDAEGDYDMAEMNEARSPGANGVTKNTDATEESAVVQNPYYGEIDDSNLENSSRNETTEDAVIVQKTQNPYYAGVDDIMGQETITNDEVEDATIVKKTENPYYVTMDSIDLENDNNSEQIKNTLIAKNPYYVKDDDGMVK